MNIISIKRISRLKSVRTLIAGLSRKSTICCLYILRRSGYLHDMGWFESWRKGQAVDHNNNPVPWYTYPFLSFLEQKVKNNMAVFEYGCGNSTLWWSKRVKEVISCEHDYNWYHKVFETHTPNITLIHADPTEGGQYSRETRRYRDYFDIIVIDGRDRVNCIKNALGALKEDGVVVWDNSDRESDADGYTFLIENGFKRVDFKGMGPINSYSWCTSIFYRKNNCFDI